ncbi:MAG: type II secretion system F family protein [Patescibacteria group bacterium]
MTNNNWVTLSNNDKLSFIGTFSTLISAGIPILETVESLHEDAKGNTRKILELIGDDLVQGKSLHISFSKFPRVFDKVMINIIKASEEAGTLDVVLKDLKKQIQKDMEFSDNVKSALTYPIIIFVVFLSVLLIILVVAMPKIATVFEQLKVDLPLPTRILIYGSNLITHYPIPLIMLIVVLGIGIYLLFKFQRHVMLQGLYSLPLISGLVKDIDLTRFSRSMFLLLSSGIPITSALELAEDVVMRRDVAEVIAVAQETILRGNRLSEAFRNKQTIFPSIILKIIEAGEKTGSLDKSMQDISDYMDYQVSNRLKSLTALLEPIMLVGTGLLVGGMMMSIIAPIYGIIGEIGGGR